MPMFDISWTETRTIYRAYRANSGEEAIQMAREDNPAPRKGEDTISTPVYSDYEQDWPVPNK